MHFLSIFILKEWTAFEQPRGGRVPRSASRSPSVLPPPPEARVSSAWHEAEWGHLLSATLTRHWHSARDEGTTHAPKPAVAGDKAAILNPSVYARTTATSFTFPYILVFHPAWRERPIDEISSVPFPPHSCCFMLLVNSQFQTLLYSLNCAKRQPWCRTRPVGRHCDLIKTHAPGSCPETQKAVLVAQTPAWRGPVWERLARLPAGTAWRRTRAPPPAGTHHTTGKRMAPQHSRSIRNRESFHRLYSVVPSSVDSMMM